MFKVVEHIVINEKIQRKGKTGEMVYLGRDTRPSGASLLEAALKVILPLGSQCTCECLDCSGGPLRVGLFGYLMSCKLCVIQMQL